MSWIALALPTAGAFSADGLVSGPPIEVLPLYHHAPGLLATGSLFVEALWPDGNPVNTETLLETEISTPWPMSLRLTATHDGTVSLRLRGPDRDVEAQVDAGVSRGTLRVVFAWNAPRKQAHLSVYCPRSGNFAASTIANPLPWPMTLAQRVALCGESHSLSKDVSGMAVASHFVPNGPLPGLSADATVETTTRQMRLRDLNIGNTLRTAQDMLPPHGVSMSPVISTVQMVLPTFGSLCPYVINERHPRGATPLFASAETLILKTGPEVDYLTGEDCVFVPTEALSSSQIRAIPAPPALTAYAQVLCAEPIAARFGDLGVSTLYFSEPAQDLAHRRLTVATDVPGHLQGHTGPVAKVLLPHEAHSLGAMRVA